ncbi:MAG: hypothetical protein HY820_24095 [Acidobacteria bacterium]|nr:hypothetical protein [Acidobacteriota bacterium]
MLRIFLVSFAAALTLLAQSQIQKEFPKISEERMQRLRKELAPRTTTTVPHARVCSIPLIEVPAAKTDERMVLPRGKYESKMPLVNAPAPACSKQWMQSRESK